MSTHESLVMKTLTRILKPGRVLLTTLPGISQLCRYGMDRWGDFWRFSARARENGIPFLDMTACFREAAKERPGSLQFRSDPHWSPSGHEPAADVIADWLRKGKQEEGAFFAEQALHGSVPNSPGPPGS